jgi:hypothetical protein
MRFSSCVAIFGLPAVIAVADSPIIDAHGSCGPLATPVCKAGAIKDPPAREEALRAAIQEGLFSGEAARREQVFRYLAENSRWIDLRPYAEIIEQFSKTDALHRGLWLLDDNELARSTRDERLAAYRTAIQNGVARLARGRPLTRESAIAFAAAEGMVELEPLATQFSPMVEERWRKSFGFEAIPALFRLGEGAKDVEDAGRIAAGRLRAMDDDDFSSRMENDQGFRAAVLQIAQNVCAFDPFSGGRNPGCADISRIVRRQAALEEKTQKPVVQSNGAGKAPVTTERRNDWLSQLRHHAPPGGQ